MAVEQRSIFDAPLMVATFGAGVTKGIIPGRNWHFEEHATWSRDTECSLLVMGEHFPKPIELMMEFRVFNASPQTPKRIEIESPGHPTVQQQVLTAGSHFIIVQSPVFSDAEEVSEIVVRLDQVESPFKLGQSSDDRMLGIVVLSLHGFSSKLAFPLDFTNSDVCRRYLASGWGEPEPHGIWTIGDRAVILLPAYLRSNTTALHFDIATLPRPEGREPMTVTIDCNKRRMLERICLPSPTEPWLCPLEDTWPEGQALEIELQLKNVQSPLSLGINADQRDLGILLRSLKPQ